MTCLKTPFPSADQARKAATNIAWKNGDRRMRPYFCAGCRSFHLAHNGRTT